jgi:hypothetical protein
MADANEPETVQQPISEPSPGPSDPNPAATRAGLNLANLAHGLKLAALLLFLLPWVTVSCAEQTLVSLSGMDLATGSVTVTNPMTGQSATPPGSGETDLPVLIAAILIAATLVGGFVLRRSLAAMVSIAGLAAAAGLISYSVLYRLPDRAREGATAESAQGISEAQIADLIRVDVAVGFWLTLFALLAAIFVTFLSRSQAPPGAP